MKKKKKKRKKKKKMKMKNKHKKSKTKKKLKYALVICFLFLPPSKLVSHPTMSAVAEQEAVWPSIQSHDSTGVKAVVSTSGQRPLYKLSCNSTLK